jgi:phosphatidate cytidylyltransferase
MISVFCISHIPALLNLDLPGFEGRNILLIIFLVIVVQTADTLQYVWSALIGEHLIAPRISKVKTYEGLIGSTLSGAAIGALLFWITPFNPAQSALMAAVICLLGFFGSLTMSAIKRDRGVRDWGPMVIGSGGFLDRLDSVIFAAPIFFHFVRFWWSA